MTEAKIQQEIFKWYNNNYCLSIHKPQHIIFSVPNEVFHYLELKKKKNMGLVSGVSDLILVTDRGVIFCEVKTTTGVQSKSQKRFENIVTMLGYEYWLVRSLEDFQSKIWNYKKK